jgi:ABC-type multidrug transport system ATPase subunit
LLSIRDDHATSILLIEHDMSVVMQISDHVVVLDYGVKISDGHAEAVRNDQKVIAAYLGVEDEEVEQVEAEVGIVMRRVRTLTAPQYLPPCGGGRRAKRGGRGILKAHSALPVAPPPQPSPTRGEGAHRPRGWIT